jgi:hypothetical protein
MQRKNWREAFINSNNHGAAAVFKFAGSVGFSDHPARFLAAALVPDSNSAVIFYRSDHMAGAGMPPFVKKERNQSRI